MKQILKILLTLFLLTSCANEKEEIKDVEEEIKEDEIIEVDEIQLQLDNMTIEEKVGQLFIIRPDALTTSISLEDVKNANAKGIAAVTDELKYLYDKYPCGGFALFGKNLVNETQLIEFTKDLHSLGKIKPLICIDEEGGMVARIANSGLFKETKLETNESIANSKDINKAYELGKYIGSYLDDYGIDLDFAPVADVNTNPKNKVIGSRAFGSDPELAGEMVSASINGFHDSNTLTCIKHFPGHGDTTSDTHKGYAETLKTWDEMLSCEMIPFIDGVESGCDMIMVAHISAPNVTGDTEPSTLSYEIITNKLRGELGFNGVVITDSLAMSAISKYYSSEEAAVKAINAGVDIILMPTDYFASFDGILNAVNDGTISIDRINESVYRILTLKNKIK